MRETYGSNERAANEGDHTPVEGHNAHSQTGIDAEQSVDNNIVRGDPAHPAEHTEGSEEVPRNPVPGEASQERVEEEAFTGHMAIITLAVALVQSVEESRVDQSTRPDHTRWPDNELAKDTRH